MLATKRIDGKARAERLLVDVAAAAASLRLFTVITAALTWESCPKDIMTAIATNRISGQL